MANAQKRESSYYVDLYLQDVASRGCKQGTLENYRRSLLNFFDWLPEGKQVSREKVYEYQEYLIGKYTSRTVNMKMTAINGILGFLDLREYQSTVKASVDDTAIQPELSRSICACCPRPKPSVTRGCISLFNCLAQRASPCRSLTKSP